MQNAEACTLLEGLKALHDAGNAPSHDEVEEPKDEGGVEQDDDRQDDLSREGKSAAHPQKWQSECRGDQEERGQKW